VNQRRCDARHQIGDFLDGIVLHQVAQWHSLGSAVVPPVTMEAMSRNMVWDGLFHLATWTITVVGVFFLWDVGRRGTLAPTSALLPFVGQLLIGWGAFNLVEGKAMACVLRFLNGKAHEAERLRWARAPITRF
jgi:uncharacterized membrane protein